MTPRRQEPARGFRPLLLFSLTRPFPPFTFHMGLMSRRSQGTDSL